MIFRRHFLLKKPDTTSGSAILPAGYVQLEYIESTGNGTNSGGQVIKPGISERGYDVVMDIYVVSKGNAERALFSTYAGGPSLINWNSSGYWLTGYGATVSSDPSAPIQDNHRYRVTAHDNGSGSFPSDKRPYMFSQNESDGSGLYHSVNVRMYSFKLSYNGTLARDMYPCYRVSDNAAGLYDIVNNVFYPNESGGTDFTKGPEYVGVL